MLDFWHDEDHASYPDYKQKIHLIAEGVGYKHAWRVKDWAYVVNIK
jgi:hypothetical protein